MLNFGPFRLFLFISYIGNNENPPITDESCWSLDIRYCGVWLYLGWCIFSFIFFTSPNSCLFWGRISKTTQELVCCLLNGINVIRINLANLPFNSVDKQIENGIYIENDLKCFSPHEAGFTNRFVFGRNCNEIIGASTIPPPPTPL